jgi:hypothetical protein
MGDNSATTTGDKQSPKPTGPLKCGDVGVYKDQQKQKTNRQERDHVPATQSMRLAGKKHTKGLTKAQKKCFNRFVRTDALTIAIPKGTHTKYSRTCKGRGGIRRARKDAKDPVQAAKDDFAKIEPRLSPECAAKYKEAQDKILAQLPDKLFEECKAKALAQC